MNPTIGRIVNYRVKENEVRAAMIVNIFNGGPYVQLQVFLDGLNDGFHDERPEFSNQPMFTKEEQRQGIAWRTSVAQGDEIGQWNWPAQEE